MHISSLLVLCDNIHDCTDREMAELKPTTSSDSEKQVQQLKQDVSALMRHFKILGRDKHADVSVVMTNFLLKAPYIQYSDPFYSHPCGYKLCLLAQVAPPMRRMSASSSPTKSTTSSPEKDSKNFFKVCVCLMQGEFDSELEIPLKGRVTIQMTNQIGDSNHVIRSKHVQWQYRPHRDPSAIPVITDIPVETLYSSTDPKYIVDGCLRFSVRLTFLE